MNRTDRREFIKAVGVCLVATHIARPLTALAAARTAKPVSLNPAEWRCLEAICAELIPTDGDPGATEAGCVNFMDKALSAEDAAALPLYQAGLATLDKLSRESYGQVFAELRGTQRREILTSLEQGTLSGWTLGMIRPQDFFATLRFHAVLGFVSDPKYGGNLNYVGWKLMGFPGPMHQAGGVTPEQMLGHQPVIPIWQASAGNGHGRHHN